MFLKKMALALFSFLMASPVWAQVTLNDFQVARVVHTANNGEIQLAILAQQKGEHHLIREYAQHMLIDHRQSNRELKDLIQRKSFRLQESQISLDLQKSATDTFAMLRPLSSYDFDVAYIDSQVQIHTSVLQIMDEMLLPATKNADLLLLLQKNRPIVARHLMEAQAIQQDLMRKAAM